MNDFAAWMAMIQRRTEAALERWLPPATTAPARLHAAMRYSVLGGGKRMRPLLCHAAGEALGADPQQVDVAACALELIHAYSLVHDDLPCMDDDVLRRGRPTCHVEFDEATALLVGDALQTLAFQLLADWPAPSAPSSPSCQRRLSMTGLLAQAAGSRGMAGGQAIDLAAVGMALTVEELEFMHIHKTGALIRAAVLLGAHCGEADEALLAPLGHYANRAGLLFQVVDDILDAEGSTVTLGKTAGKDAARDKPTYVSMLGLARAKELAAHLRSEAQAALNACAVPTSRLAALTDYIVERSF
ncbi:MAG: polyprenyl synthetase family protein [Rhodocyclaceae bacterium]|jgi:farnesyl diphosphate synthase|nr:polyprenyl synthetase family protein [Rhodocyclaceae bacterium]